MSNMSQTHRSAKIVLLLLLLKEVDQLLGISQFIKPNGVLATNFLSAILAFFGLISLVPLRHASLENNGLLLLTLDTPLAFMARADVILFMTQVATPIIGTNAMAK